MLRTLSLLGCAATVAAQFNISHTQYGTSPPIYPSPQISGAGGWDAALEKAHAFLAELTTEEKAQIVTGMRRLRKLSTHTIQYTHFLKVPRGHVLVTSGPSKDLISLVFASKTDRSQFARRFMSLYSQQAFRRQPHGIGH